MGFRQLDYKQAFVVMGCKILGSSVLSVLINIKGHSGLLWGKDALPDGVAKGPQTLTVTTPGDKHDEVDEA